MKIENCDEGTLITPSKSDAFSLEPKLQHLSSFTISASSQDVSEKFECLVLLSDSDMVKIDEKSFTFDATKEVAKIVLIDGEVP